MQKYIPKMYKSNIYEIPYQKLWEKGITHLLFDLDNTIVPGNVKKATKEVKELFTHLKKMGFTIIIFSNSPKRRVHPFGQDLEVEIHPFSTKPLKRGFRHVLKKFDIKRENVVIIGDQLFTDIIGGNQMGILTILIDPISTRDMFLTRWNRFRENRMFQKLQDANFLEKGIYYE